MRLREAATVDEPTNVFNVDFSFKNRRSSERMSVNVPRSFPVVAFHSNYFGDLYLSGEETNTLHINPPPPPHHHPTL